MGLGLYKSQTDDGTYGASDAAKRVTCMRDIPVGYTPCRLGAHFPKNHCGV